MALTDPVADKLEADERRARAGEGTGLIASMAKTFDPKNDNLLGFVLDLTYDEATIVTSDAWKLKCGGVPKNSFVVLRLNPDLLNLSRFPTPKPSLVLARVTDAVPTPIKQEIQQTVFEIHKVQAIPDPYTREELQWGALRVSILGTYYDAGRRIAFGNDIDSYLSPHFYEAYVPSPEDLGFLINSFVWAATEQIPNCLDLALFLSRHDERYAYDAETENLTVFGEMSDVERDELVDALAEEGGARIVERLYRRSRPTTIGHVRYTETQTMPDREAINIQVTPFDFIGNRTALFGKTRMGKSNTVKVIADMILSSGEDVGQVIFDLAGEYAVRGTDSTSIYERHPERCEWFSLAPRVGEDTEQPALLKVNFYKQLRLGHALIRSLWDTYHDSRPDYVAPFLAWEVHDDEDIKARFGDDQSAYKRFIRARSMYYALLQKAGFKVGEDVRFVDMVLHQELQVALAEIPALASVCKLKTVTRTIDDAQTDKPAKKQVQALENWQSIGVAARVYEELFKLHRSRGSDKDLFPPSKSSGKPYLEPVHVSILRMIGDPGVSGSLKLVPWLPYHDPLGQDVVQSIVSYVNGGKTVIIDLANGDEQLAQDYSELIARAVFRSQTDKFKMGQLGDHFIMMYFEEAHNLFRADDRDLTSIYNRLAKEGAKYHIGLVYLTQSMTTLSPDLMKNTENFFIAHLSDDREIREVTHKYEFRDIGPDIERSRTRGYVRLITLSHRFALPVQITKFGF